MASGGMDALDDMKDFWTKFKRDTQITFVKHPKFARMPPHKRKQAELTNARKKLSLQNIHGFFSRWVLAVHYVQWRNQPGKFGWIFFCTGYNQSWKWAGYLLMTFFLFKPQCKFSKTKQQRLVDKWVSYHYTEYS